MPTPLTARPPAVDRALALREGIAIAPEVLDFVARTSVTALLARGETQRIARLQLREVARIVGTVLHRVRVEMRARSVIGPRERRATP